MIDAVNPPEQIAQPPATAPLSTRIAVQDDLNALTALRYEKLALLSQTDPRVRVPPDYRVLWQQELGELLRDSHAHIVVAIEGESIVGYTVGWVKDGQGQIQFLAIDLHGYHQGVARALVSALGNWFREHGVGERVQVIAPRRSPVEQAFWRSLGATRATDDPPGVSEWETLWLTLK